ncbi:MAG: hypothetical protein JSU83_23700 [Deltaproteobacteria bacterium]|nr:MAG: hypothetical protein JSU83_23700 [Deltaproteobacteria bacterium]
MKKLMFILVIFAFIGCATVPVQHFVVLRDVPLNPSFVVLPANYYLDQIEYANQIEAALIRAGVSVKTRPHVKEITTDSEMDADKLETKSGLLTDKTSRAMAKDDAITESVSARLTERYLACEKVDADYLVETYYNNRQVKIIKLKKY